MSTSGIIYNIQRMSTQDGPGLRTTVFFKRCPLRCCWCSNPESQLPQPQMMFFRDLCVGCGRCVAICPAGAAFRDGKLTDRDFSQCTNCGLCAASCPTGASSMAGQEYTTCEVMDIVEKDATFYWNSGGGVTFSGGECTAQGAFLLALLDACAQRGFHTCVDTCGQADPAVFAQVSDKADLFLFDIKHMDSAQHQELVGVPNTLLLSNLRNLLKKYPEKVRIRVPLMPGLNDSEDNIRALAAFLLPYGIHSVDVLPCHTYGRNKYAALHMLVPQLPAYTPEALHAVLDIFVKHNLTTEIVK